MSDYILLVKECSRCTRIITLEEIHYLLGGYYCRACTVWIENDPEWKNVLLTIGHLRQIEQ